MRGLQAVERALGRLAFGLSGAIAMTCCQACIAPSRSCLPNAFTMPMLSSVFACFGSSFSEWSNCVERLVRLIRVVVADAEIGAHVDIVRRQLQRVAVPLDRVVVALGVEVQVAELDARLRVRRLALGHGLERGDLRLVENAARVRRGRRPRAAGTAPRRRAAAGAAAVACCVPMTQPAIRPNSDAGDAERDRV